MYKKHNIKLHKMGPKIGIYFHKKVFKEININNGNVIKISMEKENRDYTFLTRMNVIITIRKDVVKALKLTPGDMVNIIVSNVDSLERPKNVFYDDKIDISSLTPKKTSQFYDICVDKFFKKKQEWLRIWYSHERGSGRQIEIKRYLDIDTFGRLMGQMQAEGTKSSKKMFRFEFCNKLTSEHIDFTRYLISMGLSKNMFLSDCVFHPNVKNIKNIIYDFESETKRKVRYVIKSPKSKGGYGFRTYVRNTLLTEILLSALDNMRIKLVDEDWDGNLRIFADAFFAKLLTGDGTLDIRTKNREYDFPSTRIKISDGNVNYLRDYSELMKKLGFRPKIREKQISVRTVVGFEKLLYLYDIRAFENTNNWKKLLVLIKIYLQGRRLKTYYRFVDLLGCKKFTSLDISRKYKVILRSANDWLTNKELEGYTRRINSSVVPIEWTLTGKAICLAKILIKWKEEFMNLGYNADSDTHDILSSLKTKISQRAS